MTICVFLGPSLPVKDADAILSATYLPPAQRGDILSAVEQHAPRVIALIDGYFEQVPSVWHKELLWALEQGIDVYGAASMGALRAAELAQFGMKGVGKIFEAYASGRFDPFDDWFGDDGEVALVHGPAEIGFAASDAMVDVRATLAAAVEAGVIDRAAMATLAAAAKAIFYKHRKWATLVEQACVPETTRRALTDWLPRNRVSQKRLDAIQLLGHLRDGGDDRMAPRFRFERTLLWEQTVAGRAGERSR